MKAYPWRRLLYPATVILAVWQLLSGSVGRLVPSPLATAVALFALLGDGLFEHLLASFARLVAALSIALLLGVGAGVSAGMHRRVDDLVSPLVYGLYPLPKIAFMPLLMVFFGLGDGPKIALIVLIVVFQIYVTTRDAVRQIPRDLFVAMASLSLPRRALYRHLVFPAILPALFTTLRVSVGIAVAVLFLAENFATDRGVGYFIMNRWSMVDLPAMYAGILALSGMGLALFLTIEGLEKRFCAWTQVGKGEERDARIKGDR